MSLVCMPWIVINLGGEMLYILEQRLKAQDISSAMTARVLQDVASTMFDRQVGAPPLYGNAHQASGS